MIVSLYFWLISFGRVIRSMMIIPIVRLSKALSVKLNEFFRLGKVRECQVERIRSLICEKCIFVLLVCDNL